MRERILRSAIEKISKYGFRRFTIDEIARDLGISKKTIYKYFSSKSNLISEIVDEAVLEEEVAYKKEMEKNQGWLEKLQGIMTVYTYPDIPYRLMDELGRFFPEESAKIKKNIELRQKMIKELLNEGKEKGFLRPHINVNVMLMILHKVLQMPAEEEFLQENDITVNQLLQEMKDLILYGILKRNKVCS